MVAACSLLALNGAWAQDGYFTKNVKFPASASPEEKVQMASRLVPTSQQVAWQQLELTAFLHFGINTYTGREWGDGREDPTLFNPTNLDCEQWVRSLKNAGMKMAIITAKHHDGFCLWPTATTKHSVVSSPWKNGKGDVVRELSEACRKYGMKFGVYLSPWDRNAPSYGNSPEYNKMFIEQLTELLTNYGRVDEVWFDGANGEGPNGKRQEYDWDAVMTTIHRLQPEAVTAIMGDDVRWVGNERGLGRETEWSATVLPPGSNPKAAEIKAALEIREKSADLGSRELITRASEMFWYPSEVDVSIRPGWFYHETQNEQVKGLDKLADIYFQSVGYNSVLLLNIPPDRRGLIHAVDSTNLARLGAYVQSTFAADYAVGGGKAWSAEQGKSREFKVKKNSLVNVLMIQEDITRGQRVESFTAEALVGGVWKPLAEGTTIGYKRMFRLPDTKASRIRINIKSSRGTANISRVGLYYAAPIQEEAAGTKQASLPTVSWKAVNSGSNAALAFDGKSSTTWRTSELSALTVDMGSAKAISGFVYTPPTEDQTGTIFKYTFQTSADGKTWTNVVTNGEFSNIKNNPLPITVRFDKTVQARYFRLVPLEEIDGARKTSVAELTILAPTAE